MRKIYLLGGTGILSEDECWELLGGESVGRVVITSGPALDIFPVNYALDGDGLVFRTNAGRKMTWSLVGQIAFELDSIDQSSMTGWSVVVRGEARDISRFDCPERRLAVQSSTGSKDFLIRIAAQSITGHRVGPGQAPQRQQM